MWHVHPGPRIRIFGSGSATLKKEYFNLSVHKTPAYTESQKRWKQTDVCRSYKMKSIFIFAGENKRNIIPTPSLYPLLITRSRKMKRKTIYNKKKYGQLT
jgi:hypothetical protein